MAFPGTGTWPPASAAASSNLTLVTNLTNQTASGVILPLTYGEAITIGQAVFVFTDGTAMLADATSIATAEFPQVGIALATAAGGVNNVLVHGTYRDDVNLTFATIGGFVYLSTTEGAMTQTEPVGVDNIIQPVGEALAAHIIYLVPNMNYITHV